MVFDQQIDRASSALLNGKKFALMNNQLWVGEEQDPRISRLISNCQINYFTDLLWLFSDLFNRLVGSFFL